jgi:uncharacterized membrane protein YphA (DoxX/SURF4 family)
MFARLFKPKVDLASLAIRWGIAAIFLVHGYFKVVQDHPLVRQFSVEEQAMIGWAELVIGGLMAVGLFSRVTALAAIAHQIAVVVFITGRRAFTAFDITATGADYTRVGPEFNLVITALCVGVLLLGSGAFSLDGLIVRLWSHMQTTGPAAQTPAPAGIVAK